MSKFANLAAAGLLAGSLTMAASQARADLDIDYSTNGTTYTTLVDSANSTAFATGAQLGTLNTASGLSFSSLSASTNSPGTASLAYTTSSNVGLTNSGATAETIYLSFGATGFTSPSAPATLLSNFSDTIFSGAGGGSYSFTSYVNSGNVQNASSGPSTAPLTGAIGTPGSNASTSDTATVTTLTDPYSMTEVLKLTLAANQSITFSNSTTMTPVPEPITLAILGSGLVGIGLVRRRRSRG